MPLAQDRSLDLLASSPVCYHCTTPADITNIGQVSEKSVGFKTKMPSKNSIVKKLKDLRDISQVSEHDKHLSQIQRTPEDISITSFSWGKNVRLER